jgi:hypothetical protein
MLVKQFWGALKWIARHGAQDCGCVAMVAPSFTVFLVSVLESHVRASPPKLPSAKLAPNAVRVTSISKIIFDLLPFFPLQRRPLQRCVSMLQTDTCRFSSRTIRSSDRPFCI